MSANPVGNGSCAIVVPPASGDFCIYKGDDATSLVADWTGDNQIGAFNDWRYHADPNDSPNDDGEFAINSDSDAQYVYENPGPGLPRSCFWSGYVDSDMRGREENDSALLPKVNSGACP